MANYVNLSTFQVGADPEIFVKKNGKAVSAYGLVEGDKKNPKKTSRGAYQVDGMALEFNIDPAPANNFEEFNKNIVQTIKDLRADVDKTYSFNPSPVQEFDEEYIEQQPDEAKELGCDPDFNAYTMEQNPRPDGTRNFRTGAGHIHVGWGADIPVDNKEHFEICANFIKHLDATVGMFMVVIDRDPRRRELYGKAGAFRPKPYGVEYRTPSNVWITSREKRALIFSLIGKAIFNASSGESVASLIGMNEQTVQDVINTGQVASANAILQAFVFSRWDPNLALYNKVKEAVNRGK